MGAFNDGKNSGVTARDLTQAPDLGKVDPGRTNPVQGYDVGDQHIDHGAVCDGKDDTTAGCFLTDAQRARLIRKFELFVIGAQVNYKLALAELRVDELMKKDDDLHWVVSLALDVAGAHILGVAAKALKNAKASGLASLGDRALRTVIGGGSYSEKSWSSRGDRLLSSITDKNIDGFTKTGFDLGKKKMSKGVQNALNADDASDKATSLSFIEQLQNSCDIGFLAFSDHATGYANDAELVVLWEGMHPSNHSQAAYKAELSEKLARYKKSGVTDIGRKQTSDRELKYTSVHRDTRVVWIKNTPQAGRTLYYQSQEGDFDPAVTKPGDPGTDWMPNLPTGPRTFGPRDPRETPQLERRVPEEFAEAALARSEQLWRATVTLDPSAAWFTGATDRSPAVSTSQQSVRSPDPGTDKIMHATFFGDDDPPKPQPMDVFKQQPNSLLVPLRDDDDRPKPQPMDVFMQKPEPLLVPQRDQP